MADQAEVLREGKPRRKAKDEENGEEELMEDEDVPEEEKAEDELNAEWMEEVVEVKRLRVTVDQTESTRNKLESELMLKVSFSLYLLDAPLHHYKRVCPSVRPSGRRAVGP